MIDAKRSGYLVKFIKNGNVKIGNTIWSFNKLAGGGEICGCKGTCGEYCKGCYNSEDPSKSSCYVFKRYNMYTYNIEKNAVIKSHIQSTLGIRNNILKSFKDLDLQLTRCKKKPTAIRIHSSGEIETAVELKQWILLASKHKDIPFYIYTKAYDILDRVLSSNIRIPNNFFINISVWHEAGIEIYNKWKHRPNIRAFVYMDDYDYSDKLKINCMCPAYDANGKMNHNYTCDKCGICFNKKAKVCGCYDH